MRKRTVKKGWGEEIIWADTDKYCGKLMKFNPNSKFSMHFHADKDESWLVLDGNFVLTVIDTQNAETKAIALNIGDIWRNKPLFPHRLQSGPEGGVIVEVSTKDSVEDNYRIMPGDSQV